MASGQALAEYKRTGRRVRILDRYNRPRWSEMWEGLDWIALPHEAGDFATIQNGPQCRPYVENPLTLERGLRFSGWRARDHVGSIVLTDREKDFAKLALRGVRPFILMEPALLPKSNPNKQWGWDNWQALADILALKGHTVLQIGPRGARPLGDVTFIVTPTFRQGAAILSRAAAAVLPEGGLHHAAAVLNIPAVVLFGGAIDPQATGYDSHVNLADDGPLSPCGTWKYCPHCAEVWRKLQPETVASTLAGLLKERGLS